MWLAFVFGTPASVPESGTQPSRQDVSGFWPWDAETKRCSLSISQMYHIKPCPAMQGRADQAGGKGGLQPLQAEENADLPLSGRGL